MDVLSLKKYIYENNKIEYILESIGCHNIKYNRKKNYYSAAHKDGDNPMGCVIYNNEYLTYISYSRCVSFEDNKDLVEVVQKTNKTDFVSTIKYLHKILNLEYVPYKKQEKKENKKRIDPLAIFKDIRNKKKCIDVNEIHCIEEEAINDYVPLLHISWFKDGIMPWTRDKFGLAYSYKHKRVIIPHRYWIDGRLLGFNQRTVIDNYKELGIKKYYITEGMNKSINLYGLYEHYQDIQKAGYVVVYEAERSVLKRDSLGDCTGVAISGKVMSDEQVRILMGLDVDIIIALDNDVKQEEVWDICSKLYRQRNVYYIKDDFGWLGEKECIADKSMWVFKMLFRYKHKFGDEEYKKYIKSFSNK